MLTIHVGTCNADADDNTYLTTYLILSFYLTETDANKKKTHTRPDPSVFSSGLCHSFKFQFRHAVCTATLLREKLNLAALELTN